MRLHQALGGYFESYSIGLATMRHTVEGFLAFPSSDPFHRNRLFDVLFAGMTAKPLADAFFSMCTIAGALEAYEIKVRNTLRATWTGHTTFRNDLAHAEWNVGWETMDGEPVPPSAVRVKMRDGLPTLSNLAVDTNDIIEKINDLVVVNAVLREFGNSCRKRQEGEAVVFEDVLAFNEPAGQEPRQVVIKKPSVNIRPNETKS